MAKKKCDICRTEVGMLSQRKLKDGMACRDCMEKVGKEFTEPWAESFTVEQISKAIAGKITLLPPRIFQCANGVLIIDSSNRVMYMSMLLGRKSEEIPIDSILGYSYIEDDKKYGVGRVLGAAAVGGILFGGAGAVIGSASGFEYNGYLDTAKNLMGQLDLLIKKPAVVQEEQKGEMVQPLSNADEIRKYKGLLDEGIITQEEFEAKKRELLNL